MQKINVSNITGKEREGVLFIKKTYPDVNVDQLEREMVEYAEEDDISVLCIIEDDDADSTGLNRGAVKELFLWMDSEYINTVILRNIFEISSNPRDIVVFLQKAVESGVRVFTLNEDIDDDPEVA